MSKIELLYKAIKYISKTKQYDLIDVLDTKNIEFIYDISKKNYLQKGGKYLSEDELENTELMFLSFHGQINSFKKLIVPEDIYLTIPLCCGTYFDINKEFISETYFYDDPDESNEEYEKFKNINNSINFITQLFMTVYGDIAKDYIDIYVIFINYLSIKFPKLFDILLWQFTVAGDNSMYLALKNGAYKIYYKLCIIILNIYITEFYNIATDDQKIELKKIMGELE